MHFDRLYYTRQLLILSFSYEFRTKNDQKLFIKYMHIYNPIVLVNIHKELKNIRGKSIGTEVRPHFWFE